MVEEVVEIGAKRKSDSLRHLERLGERHILLDKTRAEERVNRIGSEGIDARDQEGTSNAAHEPLAALEVPS